MRASWRQSPRLATALAAGICASVALLAWFGFRAAREWQRSSMLLVQRRADETVNLLATALTRDMRAVQSTVLASPLWADFTFEAPNDITPLVAGAFARYPYPESFFAWTEGQAPARLLLFTRAARPPAWSASVEQSPRQYPVQLASAPDIATLLIQRALQDAHDERLNSVANVTIAGVGYQIVMQIDYRDRFRHQLSGAHGFFVNADWVREHYFPELALQTARINGSDTGLALGVADDENHAVLSTRPFVDRDLISSRAFPFLFADPRSLAVNPPPDLVQKTWRVMASGAADPALVSAMNGAHWTLVISALSAVVLAFGMLLTARALRASADLAELRTEFMSSVTHDLRTPIAAIRALGETQSGGRIRLETHREYGGLIVREAKRLSRLVDNLLAYSRVTDVAAVYAFEPLDVDELLRDACGGFREWLQQSGFAFDVSTPADLPTVRADRAAMELALDNLIDNAIKYSGADKTVRLTAEARAGVVAIRVIDRGIGIPPEQLSHVMRRFVRGRNAPAGGSGLGLAIVNRVIRDHQGTLTLDSVLGVGTTVTIELPIAQEAEMAERQAMSSPA